MNISQALHAVRSVGLFAASSPDIADALDADEPEVDAETMRDGFLPTLGVVAAASAGRAAKHGLFAGELRRGPQHMQHLLDCKRALASSA